MKKRLRQRWAVNLALFITISLLAVFIWLDEPPAPDTKPLLGGFLPVEPASISILRQGKQTIRFQKDAQGWHMLSPYKVLADINRINSLLDIYALEITAEIKPDQRDLDDFGLKNPLMQVVFNDRSLSFGDIQPVDKRRYVSTDGHVFLVADSHFQQLNTSSTSYIDRQLIPQSATPEKIMLGDRKIEKTANGWIDNRGTEQEVIEIQVSQWIETKANWITIAEDGDVQGTPVTVTLTGQQAQLQYIAQNSGTGLILVRPELGLEYHLSQAIGAQLGLAVNKPDAGNKDHPQPGE